MNKTIFVVDDHSEIFFFIESMLSSEECSLEYLNSGVQVLETLKLKTPDLILMDLVMPGMNGIELCSKIKENPEWRYIPIIMVTGMDTSEDLAACLAAGADDFITKPFNIVELKARVSSMLRIKEQYDELKELQILQEKLLNLLEGELTNEKKHTEEILDSLNEAVIVTDKNGFINYANNFNFSLFEKPRNSIIGKHLNSIAKFCVNNEESKDPFTYLTNNIPDNNSVKIINSSDNESIVEFRSYLSKTSNENSNFILIFKDITNKFKMNEIIQYQFSHDLLTGLLNRNEFDLELQKSVNNVKYVGSQYALLYLDLDQFKIINDSHGYLAGDALLKHVSIIVKNCVNQADRIFRIGGDEFTIIIENCNSDNAILVSDKIINELNNSSFFWKDTSYKIQVSIGIVLIGDEMVDSSAEQILIYADNACFVAKHNGRNRSHKFSFDDTLLTKQREEIMWLKKIKSALENNNFCLYFQEVRPVNESNTERAGEILIRMTEGGKIISPYLFIPVAEHFNKMVEIDQWVIENIFSFIRNNYDKVKDILFKINLSGHSLGKDTFISYVLDCFTKYKIEYTSICFEITETVAISNLSSAFNFINYFKSKGCLFSLDDFGSGLSSFGYLKNIPVDFVKIDGSFIREINTDQYCLNMVEAINNISHSMNLKTIAEFVENESIYNKLKDINIDYVQGYYISKPKPLIELFL